MLDGGDGGGDPGVVRYLAVLLGYVEVASKHSRGILSSLFPWEGGGEFIKSVGEAYNLGKTEAISPSLSY